MSHYTLMVATRPGERVEQLLVPYQEHACTGECPEEYLEFVDREAEMLEEYDGGSVEMVRVPGAPAGIDQREQLPDELVSPRDERFRVPGSFGLGSGTHEVPPELERVQVPFRERYATFEEFVVDYHGYEERDARAGRYGYWENPDARWDWWTVGGRWRGLLDGADERSGEWFREHASSARVYAEKKFREWLGEYRQLCSGRDWPIFQGPRDDALRLGLLRCMNEDEVGDREGLVLVPWEKELVPGVKRYDVMRPLDLCDETVEQYWPYFYPYRTYARLDRGGWRALGEMGWFGMSNDGTPEDVLAYCREFVDWVQGAPDARFTVVDCHT